MITRLGGTVEKVLVSYFVHLATAIMLHLWLGKNWIFKVLDKMLTNGQLCRKCQILECQRCCTHQARSTAIFCNLPIGVKEVDLFSWRWQECYLPFISLSLDIAQFMLSTNNEYQYLRSWQGRCTTVDKRKVRICCYFQLCLQLSSVIICVPSLGRYHCSRLQSDQPSSFDKSKLTSEYCWSYDWSFPQTWKPCY